MNKTIKFDLSVKSIENAQKELQKYLDNLQKVNTEFIRLSLDWVQKRATEYLTQSGLDSAMVQDLVSNFKKKVNKISGTLSLEHKQVHFIEFGVGLVGEQNPYPYANEFNWTYNDDSDYKHEDRHWNFKLKSSEPLDMLQSAVEKKVNKKGVECYKTYGQQGIMFMYNAIMDFANNGEVIKMLYEQAMQNCLGG